MSGVQTVWRCAAAALLALILVSPAPGQERLKDLAPGQPKAGTKNPPSGGAVQDPKSKPPGATEQRRQAAPSNPAGPSSPVGPRPPQGPGSIADVYDTLRLFGEVLNRVEKEYVGKANRQQLIEGAIRGMLKQLDPMSEYYDAQEWRELQVGTARRFAVGLEFGFEGSRVAIKAALAGSPAERAGLGAGDYLTHIDGFDLNALTLRQVRDLLSGADGSTVVLKIERGRPAQQREIALRRERIQPPGVTASVEGDIGYVRIPSFRENTEQQLTMAVRGLQAEVGSKLKGLVIDIRNNSGGLLDRAVACADAFLDSGLIVELRGRSESKTHRARPGDIAKGLGLVVLVNGATASGAEIVAAALQENKRARLVGARTWGSGTVQTIFPLTALSTPTGRFKTGSYGALKVTTHHHYTPSGRALEGNGLVPDVAVERASAGDGPASLVPADKSRDQQLQRALSLLRDGV